MDGNYEKDIYKHPMEMMERYDSLEKDLKSVKVYCVETWTKNKR